MGKQTSQTRTACILTLATLAIIALTSITVHTADYMSTTNNTNQLYTKYAAYHQNKQSLRSLDQNQDDAQDDAQNDDDNNYSDQNCDDIFVQTQPATDERCTFAQTCNSNQGLQFSFMFCNTFNLSIQTWILILALPLIIWLILLFRMLGSTAEDFFSPSLEMFSMKMGLPPRFAGVTLLALGNGAADVSATINAIVQNPQEGYQMSLGALTGAGMFVGTVVAGIVIVIADGVKCRGALVRDLIMFLTTLILVFKYFEDGVIGSAEVQSFLWMYFGFVLVVLIADVYHRAVVLPRLRKEMLDNSTEGSSTAGAGVAGVAGSVEDGNGIVVKEDSTNDENQTTATTETGTIDDLSDAEHNRKVTFAPKEDVGDVELASQQQNHRNQQNASTLFATDDETSDEVDESFATNPNQELGKKSKPFYKKRPKFMKKKGKKISKEVQKGVDTIMMALSNYGAEEGNPNSAQSFKGWSEGLEVTSDSVDKPVKLHGVNGILSKASSDIPIDDNEILEEEMLSGPQASYRMLLENVDNMCTIDGSTSSGMNISWGHSLAASWDELVEHFTDYVSDIYNNEANNIFDKFFLTIELPFSILRKLTVSIPCEDYYCRGLVALSFALAPLWFGVYCFLEKDWNLFYSGGSPVIEILTLVSFCVGIFIAKFAPSDESQMSLTVSVPIALIGFIMAATWIDTIADLLVRLLTLLGVICRIPGSIMGLTVLAWGNSMGDLSANMTMARKGLANMAITACFAGPVFNILIGLGGGFAKLQAYTGEDETEVDLTPPISVGFIFLACNCVLVLFSGLVWNRGHIPKEYGYIALTLYVFYVILSVWLQFHMGEN